MKSFDALVNAGVKLLDDNGGHPTKAYRAHEVWASEVLNKAAKRFCCWLSGCRI